MSRKKRTTGSDGGASDAANAHRSFTMMSNATPSNPEAAERDPTPPPMAATNNPKPTIVDHVPYSPQSDMYLEEGGTANKREKTDMGIAGRCCLGFSKTILIIILIFLTFIGLFAIIGGSFIQATPMLQNTQALGLTSQYCVAMGVVTLVMSIMGIIAAVSRGITAGIIFIILLVVDATLQILTTIKLAERIDMLDQDSSAFWDSMDDPTRMAVQNFFVCCGYQDKDDRPGLICPTVDGVSGCVEKVRVFAQDAGKQIYVSLYWSLGVDAALLILMIIILVLAARRQRYSLK